MKIADLIPNENNPRLISKPKLAQLKKAMLKFGDLSGVVYNRKTKNLIGGHQRRQIFDSDTVITITKKFSKPTKTGTVAEGYVELNGEKFSYREVYWEESIQKAATIAANKNAGEWDMPKLNSWLKELSDFDLDFDIGLTMFDTDELTKLPNPIEVSGHTRNPGNGKDKSETEKPAKCKSGQIYALGESRLKIGGDLHFCDRIISLWEKHSGNDAILMPSVRTVKQSLKQ